MSLGVKVGHLPWVSMSMFIQALDAIRVSNSADMITCRWH
jgi:hypothetical protein